MQLYRIIDIRVGEDTMVWCGTQSDAHRAMKKIGVGLSEPRAELVDLNTDKGSLLDLLNVRDHSRVSTLLKTYRLTPRGGLVECPNGE